MDGLGLRTLAVLVAACSVKLFASTGWAAVAGADPDVDHLPLDAAGWTIFPPDYDDALYVDSLNGLNQNSGTSPLSPIKTLTEAAKRINSRKSGRSLHVFLKRGSKWNGETLWITGGGDRLDHPLLLDGWNYGDKNSQRPSLGFVRLNSTNHVALAGIAFGPGRGESTALSHGGAGTDLLIEDCVFDSYSRNLSIGGGSTPDQPMTNFRMRRSQVVNAYDGHYAFNDESRPQGFYGSALTGALFEENLFDHNGYRNDDYSDATLFGHDIYISNASSVPSYDLRFRSNLIARGLESVRGPSTGIFEDNLFYQDGNAGYMGSVAGKFVRNIIMDNRQVPVHSYHLSQPEAVTEEIGGFGLGGSLTAGSANEVIEIQGNLFARGQGPAFNLAGGANARAVITENVVYGFQVFLSSWDSSNEVIVSQNQITAGDDFLEFYLVRNQTSASYRFEGNQYYSPAGQAATAFQFNGSAENYAEFLATQLEKGSSFVEPKYSDPARDVAKYMASLPGKRVPSSSFSDFVREVRDQSYYNWRREYRVPILNEYLRAGFVTKSYSD